MADGTSSPSSGIKAFLPWITVILLVGGWLISFTELKEQVEDNRTENVRQDKVMEAILSLRINDTKQEQQISNLIKAMEDLRNEVRTHIREDK